MSHHPTPRAALTLLQDHAHAGRLSFGCPTLDGCFRGGLPLYGITEFSGMAGSGKTQMMLHLLLQQQKPIEQGGLGGGRSLYLSTEGAFPASRLAQMASSGGLMGRGLGSSSALQDSILDRVIIVQATTVDEQLMILCSKLPDLLADPQFDIRMVIVDSVSALFRGEYSGGRDDTMERAKIIFTMGKQMKKLSTQHRVPFVVTNQVSADFSAANGAFGSNAVVPTLGLSWSTCVNTRFLLNRHSLEEAAGMAMMTSSDQHPPPFEGSAGGGSEGQSAARGVGNREGGGGHQAFWVREVRVALSSCILKDTVCRFVIDTHGIRGEDDHNHMAQ